MLFLSTYWYVWLVAFVACIGFTLVNQALRMKRMFNMGKVGEPMEGFTKGITTFLIGGFGTLVFAILLIISIVGMFLKP